MLHTVDDATIATGALVNTAKNTIGTIGKIGIFKYGAVKNQFFLRQKKMQITS